MRRWIIFVFILVVVVGLIMGGALQFAQLFVAEDRQLGIVSWLAAIGITAVAANVIVVVMGWFGISPLDFLPPRTLEQTLRKQDKSRYSLLKSRNSPLLESQTKAAYNAKEWDWTVAFARAALRERPQDERILEYLGAALVEMHKSEEAIAVARRLLEVAPLESRGYAILGDAFTQLGDRNEARRSYERGLALAPATLRLHFLMDLASTYESLGLAVEAAQALEEVIRLMEADSQTGWNTMFYRERLETLQRISNQSRVQQVTG